MIQEGSVTERPSGYTFQVITQEGLRSTKTRRRHAFARNADETFLKPWSKRPHHEQEVTFARLKREIFDGIRGEGGRARKSQP